MLSTSHNRAYQDFLTLLTNFHNLLLNSEIDQNETYVQQEFQSLAQWFQVNIASLDGEGLTVEIAGFWQSIQTEIKREFKLLNTDILFLVSARQNTTKMKRIEDIKQRLIKLNGYCQVLTQKLENNLSSG